jgi:hypothetical protein
MRATSSTHLGRPTVPRKKVESRAATAETRNAKIEPLRAAETRIKGKQHENATPQPQSDPDYWPAALDPREHPRHEPAPIELEKGRPRDTGRSGA